MNKTILHFNENAFNQEVNQLDSDLKTINAFLDLVKENTGSIKKSQYHEIVNQHDKIQFDALNEVIFQKILSEKPTLQSLSNEIDREDLKQFCKSPEYTQLYLHNSENTMAISGLVQASLLNSNPDYWSISKGQAVLVAGVEQLLKEKFSLYAETPEQLKRLDICNQIKDLTEQLYSIASKPENFKIDRSVLKTDGENVTVDPDIVIYGQHPGAMSLAAQLTQWNFRHSKVEPIPTVRDTQAYKLKQIRK